MIKYIIAGVIGAIGIGIYALAQEIGRYCEELNPYQGEWVYETRDDDFGDVVIKNIKTYKCSKCGYKPNERHTDFSFCPNCGADMRENGYTKGEET